MRNGERAWPTWRPHIGCSVGFGGDYEYKRHYFFSISSTLIFRLIVISPLHFVGGCRIREVINKLILWYSNTIRYNPKCVLCFSVCVLCHVSCELCYVRYLPMGRHLLIADMWARPRKIRSFPSLLTAAITVSS